MTTPKKAAARPVRKRPARAARPAARAKAAPAAAGESVSLARALLLLLVLAGFAASVRQVLRVKVDQHVVVALQGPLLPQGDKPGNVSGISAFKALPDGGAVMALRQGELWRLQRLDANLQLQAYLDLPAAKLGDVADLAGGKDGRVWLAAPDGTLRPLDAKLRPGAPQASGLHKLSALEAKDGGGFVALDPESGLLAELDPAGALLRQASVKAALGARGIAALPGGELAVLESRGSGLSVAVLNQDWRLQRRFKVPDVAPAAPVRIAASGQILLINDSGGSGGVLYYRSDGQPLGQTIGIGRDPITHPGWVAGVPAGGQAFIHYSSGLVRVGLPFPEAP